MGFAINSISLSLFLLCYSRHLDPVGKSFGAFSIGLDGILAGQRLSGGALVFSEMPREESQEIKD